MAAPSDRLFDALAEWEAEDTPSTRSKVEAASTDLIEAWAETARHWTAAGCPALEKPTDVGKVEVGVGELVS